MGLWEEEAVGEDEGRAVEKKKGSLLVVQEASWYEGGSILSYFSYLSPKKSKDIKYRSHE